MYCSLAKIASYFLPTNKTHLKSLEHPHLVGYCIDFLKDVVEHCNEEIDEEDVGHQKVHGHDCWGEPPPRVAGDLAFTATLRINVTSKHFTIQHKIGLKNHYSLSAYCWENCCKQKISVFWQKLCGQILF